MNVREFYSRALEQGTLADDARNAMASGISFVMSLTELYIMMGSIRVSSGPTAGPSDPIWCSLGDWVVRCHHGVILVTTLPRPSVAYLNLSTTKCWTKKIVCNLSIRHITFEFLSANMTGLKRVWHYRLPDLRSPLMFFFSFTLLHQPSPL